MRDLPANDDYRHTIDLLAGSHAGRARWGRARVLMDKQLRLLANVDESGRMSRTTCQPGQVRVASFSRCHHRIEPLRQERSGATILERCTLTLFLIAMR